MAIVQSDIVLADGDRLTIGSEESINGVIVNAGGVLTVSGGGMATDTTGNNGGIVFVYRDGIASKTSLNSGGSMYVNSAGTASVATVNADGRLEVSSGGTASGVEVLEGGSFSFAVAPDTYVQGTRGGSSFEMVDGVIAGYTVLNGRLQVSGGGIMNGAVVASGGVVWVSSGGSVNGATLNGSGQITVSGGGTVGDVVVHSGGYFQVSSGGTITGKTTLESGALIAVKDGAVFDFDISELAPDAEARINNLSLVKASPTFTLTVSDSQAAGKYTLAAGAADFDSTITVHNTAGEDLGTLDVGGMLYIGENTYRLNLVDDALTLSIIPPTITDSNGDVRLANAMPEARYMYGCAPTATAMLLGYYDLYGYRGNDFSALIDGDVDLKSRGSKDVKYTMNDFDSVLGRTTATMDYVERFYSKDSLDLILSFESTETTPAEELEYSFVEVDGEMVLRTDIWNCLADYLGTGQFWRTNGNLNTTSLFLTLEQSLLMTSPIRSRMKKPGFSGRFCRKILTCNAACTAMSRTEGIPWI